MVVSQGSMDLVGGHETSISYTNIATSDQVPPKWAEEVASWLAPLWCQLSRTLVHTLPRMRQGKHRLHKVSVANILGCRPRGGRPAVFHCGNVATKLGNCSWDTINTLILYTAIHTLYSRFSTCKGPGALVVA
jgi:hypothetical protein